MAMYDKPFEIDDEPRVPPKIRWNLQRIMRGARHLVVAERASDGSTKKINGIKIKTKSAPHSMPDENLDEVAEMVCKIMHARWVEKNLDREPDAYESVACLISAKVDKPVRGQAKTPSFEFPYDPDGEASVFDEIGELEKTTLMSLLESNERSRETDRLHIETMQERFLALAEHMAGPLASVSDILKYAGGLSLQGTQALVEALRMTHSIETTKEIEAEKTRRSEMMWNRVGGWLDLGVEAAMTQIGDYIKKKRGAAAEAAAEDTAPRGDPKRGRPRPAGKRPDPKPEPEEQDEEQEERSEESEEIDREDRIARLCLIFGESLDVRQRRKLDELLTKKEKSAFNALFCAESDEDAIEAYTHLEETTPLAKIVRLAAFLTLDQRQIFDKVRALVTKAKAEQQTDDDDEEEEEGDDQDPDWETEADDDDEEGEDDDA